MLWVMLDAYEKDIPFISKKSNIVIKSVLYPDKEFPGKITYISDVIDEKLRTIKIRVEVSDLEGLLKSNMYVRGYIENEAEGKEILAVPEDAVQIIDGEKSVFVLENDNIFAVRHVSIGEKIGNFRIITSGLEEGEKLVVEGAFSL
jgi:cobalt-zinc-cadmium efflux system membrane fusion protein